MARFDAGTAVEEMEYDFTKYGGSKGVIPEPSTGHINAYFKAVKSIVKEVRGMQDALSQDPDEVTDEDAVAIMEAMEATSDEFTETMQDSMAQALADLCQEEPSVDAIKGLPYRVQNAFSRWVMEQIQPKAQTPGTQDSPGVGRRNTTSRGRSSRSR